ncbi:hypothetical protein [Phycicoccus flavus]|uniref:Uncharacterized protein n=1 Tax=Phycicoccus flavus TaxID=2502783 RepID=A0A8T6R757_9MICO|nr:hypothetical protein [Phycicoccus flavus]NHA69393.1 hypothetical protein [Phycicoccus flavus]
MGIEEVADGLYALAPEDFTAARNARAKEARAAGDRDLASAVQALRKPTVGAALLNLLVRERREDVEQVVDLGERLRAAQGTLGPKELRTLDDERRRLTRALAQQAAALAADEGRRVSASVTAAVEETLRSAMVDADAGAGLLTGLLVDTFSSTGLDPVDLSRVLALGGGSATARRPPGRTAPTGPDPERVAAAQEALEEAQEAARRAGEEADGARRRSAETGRRRTELAAELVAARRRVAELEQQVEAAGEDERDARRAQLAATRAERSAVEAADKARRRLDALTS